MRKNRRENETIILKQSFLLFMNKGYENTTTREIATACKMEKGLLYYYYAKKQDILFDIYSDFFNCLSEYILDKYSEENDAYTTIAVLDLLYYKLIFKDERVTNILATILKNRDLTKIKIKKTMETYQEILAKYQIPYDEQALHTSTAIAIGAEVELLLMMLEKEINITQEMLAVKMIQLEFNSLNITDIEINEIVKNAKEYLKRINIKEFLLYLKDNCEWINEEILE